mgnify:CR=1 FL=1
MTGPMLEIRRVGVPGAGRTGAGIPEVAARAVCGGCVRGGAGAYAGYLGEAGTGESRSTLSDGQREHDLDIARVNIAGELMDLEAGGFLAFTADPIKVSQSIVDRYRSLWREPTERERFEQGDRWRVDERNRRLNELGVDVDELPIYTDVGGQLIQIQPNDGTAGTH